MSDAGARERVALERCRFARERCVSDVSEVLVSEMFVSKITVSGCSIANPVDPRPSPCLSPSDSDSVTGRVRSEFEPSPS